MRAPLLALATAVAVDFLLGEPPNALHPVVWIGRLVSFLERRAPAAPAGARLAFGGALVTAVVVATALPAWWLDRRLSRAGLVGTLVLGVCLKPAFAIRALLDAASRVKVALERGDLTAAREGLRSLVSRDPSQLDASLVAAAAAESVAENLSDSVVAPLCAFALAGLPGAYAYRAINTMDAMLGYRTPQHEHLGRVSARLDDLVNLVPARLTALLLVAAALLAGGSLDGAWRAARRDHRLTASPNAGWPMAAAAGALGVSLEKVGHYRLNADGRAPAVPDLGRALALARWALALGTALLAIAARLRAHRGQPA